MTQKVWRKAKALAAGAAATPYTKRIRPADEVLPRTHTGSGYYHPGDGETPIFYRPGAFDHQRHKSRGIGG